MKRHIYSFMIFVLSISVLVFGLGCEAKTTAQETTAQETTAQETTAQEEGKFVKKEPIVIGYSTYDMKDPYWQVYAQGIEEACKENGFEFRLHDQKSSEQAMVSGSIDLINANISALIISPVQPEVLPTIVDAAHDAKIPVLVGDVGAAGDYDAFIMSDNYEGGKIAAEHMIEKLKDKPGVKEVMTILLHPGSAMGEVRAAGFRDRIEEVDDIKIVAEVDGNDTVEGGYKAASDILSSNPNLAGIYACCDTEAAGAQQVLATAGLNGAEDVILIGFDGTDIAIELIKEGKMSATVAQDPYGQGVAAVEAAIKLFNNEEVEYSNLDAKEILFPVFLIDETNVDQYYKQ